jgi:DNA polymerase/3'-5' exonuclease PolX
MKFEELSEIFAEHARELSEQSKIDPTSRFRANSYVTVSSKLAALSGTATKAKIDKLPITDYMKGKIEEVLSGKRLSKKKSVIGKVNILKELTNIKGIGLPRAKELIKAGVKNISDLKLKKYKDLLPTETKLYNLHNPEKKIPNADIKKLEPYVKKMHRKSTIVGSYRRGKPFSRDIDIMLVSDNPDIIDKFEVKLNKLLDGKVYTYSKGKDKISTIIDMSNIVGKSKQLVYKLDAFRTDPEDEIPMLLYSTGSKEFNIKHRSIAKKSGYLLNQKGLFKNGKKVPNLKTEKSYFDILGINYLVPKDRI